MLRRSGAGCVIVERDGPDAYGLAASHAHRFREEDLEACADLIGVPASKVALCGRADLLRLMRQELDAQNIIVWLDRIEALVGEPGQRIARSKCGAQWRFGRAVDASGSSFAFAEKAEAGQGRELDISHLPDSWTYHSWPVAIEAQHGRSVSENNALAFMTPDCGAMIATLATQTGRNSRHSYPEKKAEAMLRLEPGTLEEPAGSYRGSALTRTHSASDVLCIGDSLIRTPPRFGDGLRHAIESARLATASPDTASAAGALDDYADQVWSGVSVAMALEAQEGLSQ